MCNTFKRNFAKLFEKNPVYSYYAIITKRKDSFQQEKLKKV